MKPPASLRLQRGQSLVGMMIGLLISLLTIAAMLVTYRNIIEATGNASRSALRDGQVASALLAAQIELQQAGFGIPATDSLDSRVRIDDAGRRLVWRFKPALDQADQCAGLHLLDQPSGTQRRGLYRLPPRSCTSAAGVTWDASEMQPIAADAAFFEPTQKDGSAYAGNDREVGALTLAPAGAGNGYRFVASSASCMPFQQQDDVLQSGRRVSLRQSSQDVLFSVCLPNLVEVAAP